MAVEKSIIGFEFENRSGKVLAIPRQETISRDRNKAYFCDIIRSDDEEKVVIEQKVISKPNIIWGSFGITEEKYPDKLLRNKLRADYGHIKERIAKKESYKNVENKFKTFEEFYRFFEEYLEKYPLLYDQFVNKKGIEIEKDAGSFLKYNNEKIKEYSADTIHLTTRQQNGHIRHILNSDISKEEKANKLRRVLSILERD